ncbi:MAG: MltA domain-containing protein [Candidatus Binatia bacterium]
MDRFWLSTRWTLGTLLLIALGSAACGPLVRPTGAPLRRVAAAPRFVDQGDRAPLLAAARESLRYFERLPPDRQVAFGPTTRTALEMRGALRDLVAFLATNPAPAVLAAEIGRRFEIYRAVPPKEVLFTGYYLPTLPARTTRDARFRFPIYGRPSDLVTAPLGDLGAPCACREQVVGRVVRGSLTPYYTRAEIDGGALGATPVLAWVEDAVGLFFLQIQGSGVLTYPDGRSRTIGFAASNGQPYVSVGKLLVERGALSLDRASMGGIRDWIAAHPDDGARLLQENPRYVFFRELEGPPIGSLGVPVTAGRTIATDPAVFPPGALAFVHVPPLGPSAGLERFVFNQDAGAAIRGTGRVDVFFGAGDEAATSAGRLRSPGELYFFVPRPSGVR